MSRAHTVADTRSHLDHPVIDSDAHFIDGSQRG